MVLVLKVRVINIKEVKAINLLVLYVKLNVLTYLLLASPLWSVSNKSKAIKWVSQIEPSSIASIHNTLEAIDDLNEKCKNIRQPGPE